MDELERLTGSVPRFKCCKYFIYFYRSVLGTALLCYQIWYTKWAPSEFWGTYGFLTT